MSGVLSSVLVRFTADISAVRDGINNATRSLTDFGNRMQSRFSEIDTGSKILAGTLAGIGVALSGVAMKGIQMSGQMEQAQIAFETMLGSAEEADKFLKQLWDFAANTPFEYEGLQNAARKLLAFGFDADKIAKEILPAVGDAVSAVGGGAAEIDRVTYALGQMQAKQKVSAEEMGQLAELGLPVWDMLARKLGVDVPTAMDMASEGLIDGTTGVNAILEGLGTKFKGSMEKQSQTLLGMWSTAKDNVNGILWALGDEIIKTFDLKDKLKNANEALSKLSSLLKEEGLKGALEKLFPPPLKEKIVVISGAIAGALIPALYGIAGAVIAATAPLVPFMVAGAAVAALAYTIYKNWDGIKDFFVNIWTTVKNTTIQAWESLKTTVINTWTSFKTQVVTLGTNLVTGLWEGITNMTGWIVTKIRTWVNDNIIQVAKNILGIASPSKVMAELGAYATEGFAVGLESQSVLVKQASTDIANVALQGAKDAVNKINEHVSSAVASMQTNIDILDTKFKLWQVTMGETVTASQVLAKETELQGIKLQMLQGKITVLNDAYEAMKKVKGETAEESRKLQLELLKESLSYQELASSIAEANKVQSQKLTAVGGKAGRAAVADMYISQGHKIVGWDGSKVEFDDGTTIDLGDGNANLSTAKDKNKSGGAIKKTGQPRPSGMPSWLASGGVITRPTLAMIGETSKARPEIVTPERLMADVFRRVLDSADRPQEQKQIVVNNTSNSPEPLSASNIKRKQEQLLRQLALEWGV